MPELPEVETNVKALRPHLINRFISRVGIFTEKLRSPLNKNDFTVIEKKKILTVRRRAKYIIVDLSGPYSLLFHLGMTGSFRITGKDEQPQKHEHVFFYLDDGKVLRYRDPRKFGLVEIWDNRSGKEPLKLLSLGPEPLGEVFDGRYLKEIAARRSIPVKTFIMDQRIVVGVGNIYAGEALFRSGIHPLRAAGRISRHRYDLLVGEIKKVLNEAIELGGSTIINYRNVDGSEGSFNQKLEVYGKEGENCSQCKSGKIRRKVIGGRSSFYCPNCQR